MTHKRGALPHGWVWSTLGEIGLIVRGISFPKDQRFKRPQPGLVACLRTANVQAEVDWDDLWFVPEQFVRREEQNVQLNDILISTANSLEHVGKVALVKRMPHPASLGAFISLIRVSPDLDPRYIYHQLAWSEMQSLLRSWASTTTNISNISTTKLADLPVRIVPLPEQRRIVAEIERQFTRLDAGVAALKRVQANLKRYDATVLKSACEGRLAPQDAADEPADRLLARILAERRAKWEAEHPGKKYVEPAAPVTDGLPELPAGWCWATVEQLADVGTGGTPLRGKSAYYDGGTVPWVTSGALNQPFVHQPDEFITELAVKETNAKVFPSGSLLIAMYGEGRTRGKVSELRIDAATNQACAILTFGSSACIKPYTKLFLQKNYDDIRRLSSGGVQPNLNLSIVRRTLIPIPPLPEQDRIVAEVERRLSVVAELEAGVAANLARAGRLRQAVLKRAFEGRL